MNPRTPAPGHPTPTQLEAAAFGQLAADEARAVRAHALGCPGCRSALTAEEAVGERLALLRVDEPRVDVVVPVLDRIAAERPRHGHFSGLLARPRAPWPAITLVLVVGLLLGGLTAVAAGADKCLPGLCVREATAVRLPVLSTVDPQVTPNPANMQYAPIERLTLAEARTRLPFTILEPAVLPVGYRLAYVELPRGTVDPPVVTLAYQRPGATPDTMIFISETGHGFRSGLSPIDGSNTLDVLSNTVEEITVNGQPAFYLRALTAQRPGEQGTFIDETRNVLIMEREGVRVRIDGSRAAGIGRAELERIAASLR